MATLWAKDGKLLVGDDDKLIACDDCPCDILDKLLVAIRERQLAWGITTAWSSGDPANPHKLIDESGDTTYTMAELRDYVNHLTVLNSGPTRGFLDPTYNDWAGGAVSAPAFLNTSTWATSGNAADEQALYDLVITLQKTGYTTRLWLSTVDKQYGNGAIQSGTPPPWQAAYDSAVAALTYDAYAFRGASMYRSLQNGATRPQVRIEYSTYEIAPTGLTTEVGKSVKVYEKLGGDAYFPYVGFYSYAGAENEYVLAAEFGLGMDASGTSPTFGATGNMPTLDDVPEPAAGALEGRCCQDLASVTLISWAFTY